MKRRLARCLPLVVLCIAMAVITPQPAPPLLLALLALSSTLVRARIPGDRATQRLTMVVLLVLVIAGVRASGMPERGPGLGAFGYGFALAPLAMVTFRLWGARAEGAPRADLFLCLLSLLGMGGARAGAVYFAFVIAFLAAALAEQRVEDPNRPRWPAVSGRTRRIAAAMVAGAALAASGAAMVLQLVHPYVQQRFQRAFDSAYGERLGLSDTMHLGEMTGLLASDTIVLRVFGAPIDRVRGVVLDEYAAGRWTRAQNETPAEIAVPRTLPEGRDRVELRHAGADDMRLLLPLEASEIATPRGALTVESTGVAHQSPKDPAPVVWLRRGDYAPSRVASPRPTDLLVASRTRKPLESIAREWTADAKSPEEALLAIQSHLHRDYTYSLAARPRAGRDPVLEFLTVQRTGHCEYFASALALLGRSIGIPTRLVLGYRVAERNPYFAHYVVRKKNAHAWVEAFVGDRWVTFDPTPMSELPQDLPHDEGTWAGAGEMTKVVWSTIETWLAERSIFELAAAAILGVVTFAVQRWWRRRRAQKPDAATELAFMPPHPSWLRLEAELARLGRGRRPSESIEGWAERLSMPDLSPLLLRYADARYGGAHDEALDADLARASRSLTTRRRPP